MPPAFTTAECEAYIAPQSQQQRFNAELLAQAKTFTLTATEAAAIRANAHPFVALQIAMGNHLNEGQMAECRMLGFVLMPMWVQTMIGHGWTKHSAEFMACAERALGEWPEYNRIAALALTPVRGEAA